MSMVASVVKLLAKSPSPAIVILASMPGPPAQSATTTKPPLAVRVASILAHVIGEPSVGSIGLPSMHLVPGVAGAPSWLELRDHCPAVGAGSCAIVIGPAGPVAVAAAAAGVAAPGVAAAALVAFAAVLSAGFEHPASAKALTASPITHPPHRSHSPAVVFRSCDTQSATSVKLPILPPRRGPGGPHGEWWRSVAARSPADAPQAR